MTNNQLTTPHRNGLLFLCVGNGARSHMAEAFARFIGPADIQYYSAGSTAEAALHPLAIKAMREVGVDISQHRPRTLEQIPLDHVATIVSLCEQDECPPLPDSVHHLSWPLPDPMADAADDDELLQAFRRVRDQIRELVSRLF